MKIFGFNLLTDTQVNSISMENYKAGIADVKEILQNKSRHSFFFSPEVNISGEDIKIKRLVFLGGGVVNMGTTVHVKEDLGLTFKKMGKQEWPK